MKWSIIPLLIIMLIPTLGFGLTYLHTDDMDAHWGYSHDYSGTIQYSKEGILVCYADYKEGPSYLVLKLVDNDIGVVKERRIYTEGKDLFDPRIISNDDGLFYICYLETIDSPSVARVENDPEVYLVIQSMNSDLVPAGRYEIPTKLLRFRSKGYGSYTTYVNGSIFYYIKVDSSYIPESKELPITDRYDLDLDDGTISDINDDDSLESGAFMLRLSSIDELSLMIIRYEDGFMDTALDLNARDEGSLFPFHFFRVKDIENGSTEFQEYSLNWKSKTFENNLWYMDGAISRWVGYVHRTEEGYWIPALKMTGWAGDYPSVIFLPFNSTSGKKWIEKEVYLPVAFPYFINQFDNDTLIGVWDADAGGIVDDESSMVLLIFNDVWPPVVIDTIELRDHSSDHRFSGNDKGIIVGSFVESSWRTSITIFSYDDGNIDYRELDESMPVRYPLYYLIIILVPTGIILTVLILNLGFLSKDRALNSKKLLSKKSKFQLRNMVGSKGNGLSKDKLIEMLINEKKQRPDASVIERIRGVSRLKGILFLAGAFSLLPIASTMMNGPLNPIFLPFITGSGTPLTVFAFTMILCSGTYLVRREINGNPIQKTGIAFMLIFSLVSVFLSLFFIILLLQPEKEASILEQVLMDSAPFLIIPGFGGAIFIISEWMERRSILFWGVAMMLPFPYLLADGFRYTESFNVQLFYPILQNSMSMVMIQYIIWISLPCLFGGSILLNWYKKKDLYDFQEWQVSDLILDITRSLIISIFVYSLIGSTFIILFDPIAEDLPFAILFTIMKWILIFFAAIFIIGGIFRLIYDIRGTGRDNDMLWTMNFSIYSPLSLIMFLFIGGIFFNGFWLNAIFIAGYFMMVIPYVLFLLSIDQMLKLVKEQN